ncbi:MAG: FAD-dependent oxidoreductase [Myxococcota bacterium]
MQEFRFHGRGGQGVVILSKLVARLYFQLGKHVKEFPKFGVERRGAPVEGYVRVDDTPIDLNCQIYEPDTILVMADSILDNVDVTSGMDPGGLVLVNTGRPPQALTERLGGFRVATIDASAIALNHGLGTPLAPIANTSLFGAFARMMGVEFDQVEKAIDEEIKRPANNADAARDAFEAVSVPELLSGTPQRREGPKLPFASLDDLPLMAYSSRDARGNRTGSWRSQRPRYSFKIAPCNARCPAGNDVRGFLEALAEEKPALALEILLKTSPFPGTCGRVCPHPCEDECNRTHMDGCVPVMALERFAEAHAGDVAIECAPCTDKRIAVVGAGPAGLSAAWQLARRGHKVTVYEAAPQPGGMLLLGIPAYRLPRDLLKREIDRIVNLGVEIHCNKKVGVDIDLDVLRSENDAVLLAVGQQFSAQLEIPGEELATHGLPFLRDHNLGNRVEIGEQVVVIGGGNTAIDCAGVAVRLSKNRNIKIVYRRSREQMPAIAAEIAQTLAEGVELLELTAPLEVVTDDHGKIKALACEKMKLGEKDSSGRPRPVPIPNSRFEIRCDQVILATGQRTDLDFAGGLELDEDEPTTSVDGVLIAGDAHDGAGTVTAAIGSGRRAADAIHTALGGELPLETTSWAPRTGEVLGESRINPSAFEPCAPAEAPRLPIERRWVGFDEVVGEVPNGCTEAERCMSCGTCTGCDRCYIFCPEPAISRNDGIYTINLDYCKGCGICFEECPRGVVDLLEEGS